MKNSDSQAMDPVDAAANNAPAPAPAPSAPKKRGRPKGSKNKKIPNPKGIGFPSVTAESADDVRAALSNAYKWYGRGCIKPSIYTADIVQERARAFFEECIAAGERPTVEKLALCVGVATSTLHEWQNMNNARADVVKRAKQVIAAYDAELATSGKMPAVPYIFRAKNYYGMRDDAEITVNQGVRLTPENAVEVVQKYAELPPD